MPGSPEAQSQRNADLGNDAVSREFAENTANLCIFSTSLGYRAGTT
jgi:hypothetical protein